MLKGYDFLIIGHDDWTMWRQVNTFASYFAKYNRVIFVERVKYLRDLRKEGSSWTAYLRRFFSQTMTEVDRNLVVMSAPPMLPLTVTSKFQGRAVQLSLYLYTWLSKRLVAAALKHKLNRWQFTPSILMVTRPLDLLMIRWFTPMVACWYVYDETSLFYSDPLKSVIKRVEHNYIQNADIVFTSSFSQYKNRRQKHESVHCVPNAVDFNLFHQDNNPLSSKQPWELHEIPRPRIVYIGQFGGRDDLKLLYDVFMKHPEWSLVMIGWIKKYGQDEVYALLRLPNVHYLGSKPYYQMPDYLQWVDVGLIPFHTNESTHTMLPLKLFEYLATGLPVISTPIREVIRFSDVAYIAANPIDFAHAIRQALAEDSLIRREKRIEVAAASSWAVHLPEMEHQISIHLSKMGC